MVDAQVLAYNFLNLWLWIDNLCYENCTAIEGSDLDSSQGGNIWSYVNIAVYSLLLYRYAKFHEGDNGPKAVKLFRRTRYFWIIVFVAFSLVVWFGGISDTLQLFGRDISTSILSAVIVVEIAIIYWLGWLQEQIELELYDEADL